MKKNVRLRGSLSNALVFLPFSIISFFYLLAGSVLAQNILQQPGSTLTPCGHFSSIFLRPQDISYSDPSPTHITLMTSRWSDLQISAAGYEKTGVRLVGWDGSRLVPTEFKDDSGFDYFVPQLTSLFRLSLVQGADFFIGGMIVFCYSLGALGLLLVLQGRWLKAWAMFELVLLALLGVYVGDVYVVQSSIAILIIPWVLYFSRNWQSGLQSPFFLAVGVALGVANFVRAHAGTVVLLFCLPLLAFYGKTSVKRRVLLMASLLAGTTTATLYFRHAFVVRDAYIQNHQSGYLPPAPHQHPVWHSIYIGLGFVSNPYVPGGYCDQVGLNEVQAVSPSTDFFSPAYDRILGQQVYQLAKNHPYVLVSNVAAKLGILQLIVLLAGNIGWLAVRYRKPLSLDAAFLAAAGFGVLPGLLTMPVPKYVVGGITVLVVYGLVSLNHMFQEGGVRGLSGLLSFLTKAASLV